MSLETLRNSQQAAAELTGVEITLPETHLCELGAIAIDDITYPAFRAHCGQDDLVGKGGIRMASYPTEEIARETAKELSVEMWYKLALRGHADHYKGGKGLIVVDAQSLDHAQKEEAARQFEGLMENAGLAGHHIDVPAGDVGTNGLAGVYALERQRRHPQDKLWQASITGKPPELGGLEFRTAATGWGVYVANRSLMDARGLHQADATVQGFGNVGSWYAFFASDDPEQRINISAISDQDGTLSTDHPAGLTITRKMVTRIGDNPRFADEYRDSKLVELARMIESNQPGIHHLRLSSDPQEVLTKPTDYFVPMALGNAVNLGNVATLGAARGVIEGANGPAMPAAHQYLVQHGLDVIPDIVANGAGVDCSIMEHGANITDHKPVTKQVQHQLTGTTEQLMKDVFTAAERLDTQDFRIAAAALSQARAERNSTLAKQLVG